MDTETKTTSISTAFLNLGVLLGVFLLLPKVLSDMWLWFVVPLGVMDVSYIHMAGLNLIPSLLLGVNLIHLRKDKKPTNDTVSSFVWQAVSVLLASWGAAYCLYRAM